LKRLWCLSMVSVWLTFCMLGMLSGVNILLQMGTCLDNKIIVA
jgi:hypothetical protein